MSTLEEVESKLLEMSTTNEYIPNEVMIQILSRLPGKSLMVQFRWVCKYWFDLITKDTNFAKLQLVNHAINNPLLICSSYIRKTKSLVLSSFNCTELVDNDDRTDDEGSSSSSSSSRSLLPSVTRLFNSLSKNSYTPTVVGSCNGLLCIRIRSEAWDATNHVISSVKFCIWNPCTNEFKDSSVEPIINRVNNYNFYGFGYDQTIDDYKVISNSTYWIDNHYVTAVQVYTLGTNSWRRIENYYPFHCRVSSFVSTGASFYCLGGKSLRHHLDVIVCFDIAKEEYREISKPWFVGDLDFVDLIELNGCLGLAQPNNNSSQSWVMEVWMMKDYCHDNMNKNEYSWTKQYTIREQSILRYGFKSLGIFNKNGDEILIQMRSKDDIYWYNGKDDNVRKIRSPNFCGNVKKVVEGAYVESLVSLNSGTYMSLNSGSS